MPELFTPSSLEELLALLKDADAATCLAAGGTDWLARHGRSVPDDLRLIDLSAVGELRGIALSSDALTVGAMETMSSIAAHPDLKRHAVCLAEAAASVGSWQIRNRATPGGNLANASPAADTPSALAALDTTVEVVSCRGVRKLSVPEVLGKPNRNTLQPDEVIAAFRIPLKPGRISAFGKIGSRSEVSIARLNLAVSAVRTGNAFEDARIFVGTLGSAAQRCPEAERTLESGVANMTEAFCGALADAVDRSIPGRTTRPYKRTAIQALGEDVLEKLTKAAEEARS